MAKDKFSRESESDESLVWEIKCILGILSERSIFGAEARLRSEHYPEGSPFLLLFVFQSYCLPALHRLHCCQHPGSWSPLSSVLPVASATSLAQGWRRPRGSGITVCLDQRGFRGEVVWGLPFQCFPTAPISQARVLTSRKLLLVPSFVVTDKWPTCTMQPEASSCPSSDLCSSLNQMGHFTCQSFLSLRLESIPLVQRLSQGPAGPGLLSNPYLYVPVHSPPSFGSGLPAPFPHEYLYCATIL